MAVRQVTNAEGKRAIGRLAASLVPDGASVILASGTHGAERRRCPAWRARA